MFSFMKRSIYRRIEKIETMTYLNNYLGISVNVPIASIFITNEIFKQILNRIDTIDRYTDIPADYQKILLSDYISTNKLLNMESAEQAIRKLALHCEALEASISKIEKLGDTDTIIYSRRLKRFLDTHKDLLETFYKLYTTRQ